MVLLLFWVPASKMAPGGPQSPKIDKKVQKIMKKMRHCFQASGLQLWPGRPSSRPQSLQLAGAAGRLHGGCADQNKPMATVTAMMDFFWSAHPP